MNWLRSVRGRKIASATVWLAGLVIATVLIASRPAGDAQGIAHASPVVLSAPEDGTLLAVTVSLHDEVAPGQLLARLDPAPLLARSEILAAEIRALDEDESASAQNRTRQFQGARDDARLELSRLRASVAEDEALLATKRAEYAVERDLADRGLRARREADDLAREISVLETRLAADRTRMSDVRRAAEAASQRAAGAVGPNSWQVVVGERRLDELSQRLERLDVRSPLAGQVTEVRRAAGEWLKAGEAVLRVSPRTTREVHVWTDARTAGTVEPGQSAVVRRPNGRRLEGVVLSVAAEQLALPEELWYRPDIREWGYLVRVETRAGELLPGERLRVSLRR